MPETLSNTHLHLERDKGGNMLIFLIFKKNFDVVTFASSNESSKIPNLIGRISKWKTLIGQQLTNQNKSCIGLPLDKILPAKILSHVPLVGVSGFTSLQGDALYLDDLDEEDIGNSKILRLAHNGHFDSGHKNRLRTVLELKRKPTKNRARTKTVRASSSSNSC